MLKRLLTLAFIILAFIVKAQTIDFKSPSDTSINFGLIKEYAYLGKDFSDYNSYASKTINNIAVVPILAARKGKHGYASYEIIYKGKIYFIDAKKVETHPETFNFLLAMDPDKFEKYRDFTIYFGEHTHDQKVSEAIEWVEKTGPSGIAILKRQVYDESEYTSGTGIEFKFINTSKKTIKYIWFNFTGYNAVDDPVSTMKTRKGIGPIKHLTEAAYTYEYVWMTDIVEYARLNSIKIQYMDNSIKTLSASVLSKLFVPQEYKEIIEDIDD